MKSDTILTMQNVRYAFKLTQKSSHENIRDHICRRSSEALQIEDFSER